MLPETTQGRLSQYCKSNSKNISMDRKVMIRQGRMKIKCKHEGLIEIKRNIKMIKMVKSQHMEK